MINIMVLLTSTATVLLLVLIFHFDFNLNQAPVHSVYFVCFLSEKGGRRRTCSHGMTGRRCCDGDGSGNESRTLRKCVSSTSSDV